MAKKILLMLISSIWLVCSCAGTGSAKKSGCIKGNCWVGKGTYVYPNGNVYTGLFHAGKPNGHGTMKFHNGVTLKGKWKWGKPDFK